MLGEYRPLLLGLKAMCAIGLSVCACFFALRALCTDG